MSPIPRLSGDKRWVPILAALFGAGLLLRLVIVSQAASLEPTIVDEQHYHVLARSLVGGYGFAWGPGEPTSLRPPVYPGLLAAVWTVAGKESLQAIRVLQALLAALTVGLVYLLGTRVYGPKTGTLAAVIVWLYPSLIFLNVLILTETLFTLLLVAFLLLAVLLVDDRVCSPSRPVASIVVALGCGAVLGLGALTRSVLWPLPIVFCPLLVVLIRGSLGRRVVLAVLVLAGYGAIVAPWAIRNTRLQGVVTIVDTMGGLNLRMGNYEHTPEDRMWDAVSLTGEKNWVHGLALEPGVPVTEGRKDKWAQGEALRFMRSHPWVTFRRSLIKIADFWGLEREFIAGARDGLFKVPVWFAVTAGAVIVLAYVVAVISGAAGAWLAPPIDTRFHVLLLLPVVFITGLHALTFGHSRYHVPLMPVLAIYASALMTQPRVPFRQAPPMVAVGTATTIALLLVTWGRQVLIVDWDRIAALAGW